MADQVASVRGEDVARFSRKAGATAAAGAEAEAVNGKAFQAPQLALNERAGERAKESAAASPKKPQITESHISDLSTRVATADRPARSSRGRGGQETWDENGKSLSESLPRAEAPSASAAGGVNLEKARQEHYALQTPTPVASVPKSADFGIQIQGLSEQPPPPAAAEGAAAAPSVQGWSAQLGDQKDVPAEWRRSKTHAPRDGHQVGGISRTKDSPDDRVLVTGSGNEYGDAIQSQEAFGNDKRLFGALSLDARAKRESLEAFDTAKADGYDSTLQRDVKKGQAAAPTSETTAREKTALDGEAKNKEIKLLRDGIDAPAKNGSAPAAPAPALPEDLAQIVRPQAEANAAPERPLGEEALGKKPALLGAQPEPEPLSRWKFDTESGVLRRPSGSVQFEPAQRGNQPAAPETDRWFFETGQQVAGAKPNSGPQNAADSLVWAAKQKGLGTAPGQSLSIIPGAGGPSGPLGGAGGSGGVTNFSIDGLGYVAPDDAALLAAGTRAAALGRKFAYIQLPDGSALAAPAVEARLRAFEYYKSLDPSLSAKVFFSQTLEVPPPTVGDEGLGQEEFRKKYGVNPFVDTQIDHVSTFGMDVDTAAYTHARGLIFAGRLPEPKTVRVEEFVNHFREDVTTDPSTVFTVRSEGGPSPFGQGLDLLRLTVKARDLLPQERKSAVLTFAVDTSGSMGLEKRLDLVQRALETLVASLQPDDRVAIVAFGGSPYLVLPHTPARERERIVGAVRSLASSGATNVEAGLELAYRVADEVLERKAVNRVILCSDGVANVGARGPEAVLRKAEVFSKRGIYLSCVGFGMGKYNDRLLETLADKGNGNYAYADDQKAAADVFQKNLPATLQVLAQDAKVQVDFNTDVVSNYRLVGYENRDIADRDFRNDKVDAGEVGPGTTVTVLYEVLRRPGSSGEIGKVHVRYRDTGTGRVEEESYPLPPGVVATRLEETSDRFRFIASAAETAELLRGSYWARNGSYGKVLETLH
ncbi:MAG TPA: von Willebrand factor type A domain-containing protein, partial [Planctomycetota bacterium]|nr:von Willebrand factor type A domain-containing protein [Planctomycetota bacterium]